MTDDYFGLILSAGRGTRMRPFAPKEMLPFINKSIIVHAIDALKYLGVDRINIVVGEGKYNIQEHVGDGSAFDVRVSYDFQHILDGDAGGIRCAHTTKYSSAKYIVVFFGDTLFSDHKDLFSLKEQFEKFKEDPDYVGAVAFKKYPAVIPEGAKKFPYGVALINNELIERIIEKPGPDLLSEFENNGLCESITPAYIFKKEALFDIIDELYAQGSSGEYHLSDAIKLAISKSKKFSGLSIKGKGLDMGQPLPYLTALRDWFINASDEDIVKAAREWCELSDRFRNGA